MQLSKNNVEDYADRRGLLLEFIGNCEELNITAIDILLRRWLFLRECVIPHLLVLLTDNRRKLMDKSSV